MVTHLTHSAGVCRSRKEYNPIGIGIFRCSKNEINKMVLVIKIILDIYLCGCVYLDNYGAPAESYLPSFAQLPGTDHWTLQSSKRKYAHTHSLTHTYSTITLGILTHTCTKSLRAYTHPSSHAHALAHPHKVISRYVSTSIIITLDCKDHKVQWEWTKLIIRPQFSFKRHWLYSPLGWDGISVSATPLL